MQINLDELNKEIEAGYIIKNKHPEKDLWIYNYANKAQFDSYWNQYTLMCRGLILDSVGNVIARPFQKFFNIEEHFAEESNINKNENIHSLNALILKNEPFKTYDKMDGSLGILYFVDNTPFIASRGSFASEQAIKGTEMLREKYGHVTWNPQYTYLFEIIYPENQIVLDYEDKTDLVLLAIIHTETGMEEDIGKHSNLTLPAKLDNVTDIFSLKAHNIKNKEGYVIKFENNFRVKIKFEDYINLHRLRTRLSNVDIWENLKTGQTLEVIINLLPDEVYNWVKQVVKELEDQFSDIKLDALMQIHMLNKLIEKRQNQGLPAMTRKEIAIEFLKYKHSSLLFIAFDGKSYSEYIWKLIKPKKVATAFNFTKENE